jgi:hypothetical protein
MMLHMRQIASAAAVTTLLLTVGCGAKPGPDAPQPHTPGSTATSGAPTDPASSSKAITFGDKGVFIQTADDVAKLTGTSAAFKAFIANRAAHLQPPAGANDCEVGVTVNVYDPTGFARGAVNECGGYVALWGRQDGTWKELIGTQDEWACADLRKFNVPPTISDTCYESMKSVPYRG